MASAVVAAPVARHLPLALGTRHAAAGHMCDPINHPIKYWCGPFAVIFPIKKLQVDRPNIRSGHGTPPVLAPPELILKIHMFRASLLTEMVLEVSAV